MFVPGRKSRTVCLYRDQSFLLSVWGLLSDQLIVAERFPSLVLVMWYIWSVAWAETVILKKRTCICVRKRKREHSSQAQNHLKNHHSRACSFSCLLAMCFMCELTQKSFLDQSQQESKDSITPRDQHQSSGKRIVSHRGLWVPFVSHREITHQAELA